MLIITIDSGKRVERHGILDIRRIDDTYVSSPVLRDEIQNGVYQIAVRIYDTKPVTGSDVLPYQQFQKLGLPDSAFSDGVYVLPAIYPFNAENKFLFFKGGYVISPTDVRYLVRPNLAVNWQFRRRRSVFYYL